MAVIIINTFPKSYQKINYQGFTDANILNNACYFKNDFVRNRSKNIILNI